jgi:hypothetical protein
MRYATTPRWVYYMLVVMGIGFTAGAGAFLLFVPAPAGTIVGAIWVLMGAGMVFFSLRALARRREDEQIAHTGSAATATVLDATMTGLIVNNVPQWALRLRIDGYGASYETKLKLLTFTPPSNGSTFSVRVDPARREHVVLASDDAKPSTSGVAGGSATVADVTAANLPSAVQASVLDALRKAGLGDGESTTTVNPDGSRTITMTSVDVGGSASGAPLEAADTVKLLAELDRLHENGALAQDEFDTLKRKLLGES